MRKRVGSSPTEGTNASVAPVVEQGTEDPRVGSSNLPRSTK